MPRSHPRKSSPSPLAKVVPLVVTFVTGRVVRILTLRQYCVPLVEIKLFVLVMLLVCVLVVSLCAFRQEVDSALFKNTN